MHSKIFFELNYNDLKEFIASAGSDPSLAKRVFTWVYRRGCCSFISMDDIPLSLRQVLASQFAITTLNESDMQISSDGTIKSLFHTANGNPFETAYMPGKKRNTLCISTQSGCRMGCSFCRTGSMGFRENLSVSDIIGQVLWVKKRATINRIVLMGMGEPLDNFNNVQKALKILVEQWGMAMGAANISVSTVGIIPQLEELIDLGLCNIAISLHSPFPQQRCEMMPSEENHPITEVVEMLRRKSLRKSLRLSFEYVAIPNENCSAIHAEGVVKLLSPLSCIVNVIPLNAGKNDLKNELAARELQKMLNSLGQSATLRLSRGHDIEAACGRMAGRANDNCRAM